MADLPNNPLEHYTLEKGLQWWYRWQDSLNCLREYKWIYDAPNSYQEYRLVGNQFTVRRYGGFGDTVEIEAELVRYVYNGKELDPSRLIGDKSIMLWSEAYGWSMKAVVDSGCRDAARRLGEA